MEGWGDIGTLDNQPASDAAPSNYHIVGELNAGSKWYQKYSPPAEGRPARSGPPGGPTECFYVHVSRLVLVVGLLSRHDRRTTALG